MNSEERIAELEKEVKRLKRIAGQSYLQLILLQNEMQIQRQKAGKAYPGFLSVSNEAMEMINPEQEEFLHSLKVED